MTKHDPELVRHAEAVATGIVASTTPPSHAQLSPEAEAVAHGLRSSPLSPVLVSGFARLIEFAIAAFSGFALYAFYVGRDPSLGAFYTIAVLGASLMSVVLVQLTGGYAIAALRGTGPQIGRVYGAWTLVFALLAVATFLAKMGDTFSRVWFAAWYVTGLVAFTGFRVGLSGMVRRWTREGLLERRAVIVGGGKPAEDLIAALTAQPDNDIRICGIFDDRKDERSPASVAGHRKLGSVLPVDIRLSAHTNRLRFRPRTYSFVGKVPFLDVVDRPIADWDVVAKWLVDRLVGGLILLLALPVMALVALAVKLDSKGPVLFKQKRYGFNNELIEVYKFRSMYTDRADAGAAKLVTRGDPRVTRVGRIIRKTSLDELPQLFNVVFRGNLSLVGPRPHAVQAKAENRLYDEVVDGYFARHRVKPGITGWAQVNGWRGETDTREKIEHRVEHDLYYIENWSVLLDLYIIAVTPIRLLSTENAY